MNQSKRSIFLLDGKQRTVVATVCWLDDPHLQPLVDMCFDFLLMRVRNLELFDVNRARILEVNFMLYRRSSSVLTDDGVMLQN